MQKLHIDEFYRKTVPDGTPDCEPDPGFNYDKACSIAYSWFPAKFRCLWTRSMSALISKQTASCPAMEGSTWKTLPSAPTPYSTRWLSNFFQNWKMTTQLWGRINDFNTKNGPANDFKGLQDCRLLLWSYPRDQWTQRYEVHLFCKFFYQPAIKNGFVKILWLSQARDRTSSKLLSGWRAC